MLKLWSLLLLILFPIFGFAQRSNGFHIRTHSDVYLVPIAVGFLGSTLIASHILSPETYSWKMNTISELGAQNYDNAWITRAGFVGFGSFISGAAAWDLVIGRKHWARTLPVVFYGTSVALSGVFSTSLFERGVRFSEDEADLHTMFANVAGFSLSAAILGHALTEEDDRLRIFHFSTLAVVTLCSVMFHIQPEYQGVWQRLLWTSGLTWLTVSYSF